MDGGLLPEQKTENIKNPSCLNKSVQTGGIPHVVNYRGNLDYSIKTVSVLF